MSSLRGIKRMEFPLSVRKKAFVRCCRDGVPHCEGCGIEINARTGIIYEHVIPAGLGGEPTRVWQKIDAIRAKQASKPKHSPLPQNRDDFQRAGKRHDEIRARPRRGTGEAVPGGAARTRGGAGRVPDCARHQGAIDIEMNAPLPYWPAALRLDQAAAYVGLSVDTFKEVCPIKPIHFTQSTRGHRYLRASLDNWLVSLDQNGPNSAPTRRRIAERIGDKN